MKNIELLRKQYFIHPDKTDEEVIKEVAEIDAYVKHKIITDIDYVPKNIEEARQHPLWVEGHLPILHRFNIVILIISFITLIAGSRIEHLQEQGIIIGAAPMILSVITLIILKDSKKNKNTLGNANPLIHYGINALIVVIVSFLLINLYSIPKGLALLISPFIIINIVAILCAGLIERKRYDVNYPPVF